VKTFLRYSCRIPQKKNAVAKSRGDLLQRRRVLEMVEVLAIEEHDSSRGGQRGTAFAIPNVRR